MFYVITVDQIIRWTQLLYLLLAAVWLGSLPFVKRTVHKQSISSFFSRRFSLESASICSLVRPHARLVQSTHVPRHRSP